MTETAVYDILNQIKQLPEDDRLLLDDLLARDEEGEWRHEAAEARRKAGEKGIDQATIDRAVHAFRHGG
jgi:hypothetical protein